MCAYYPVDNMAYFSYNMHMLKKICFIIVIYICTLPTLSPVLASGVGIVTGFPIPRFVSTKSNENNIRTGPSIKYPVRFILQARAPLQIIDEYQDWRQITDWEGENGWIHKALLTGTTRAIVITPQAHIYKKQTTDSPVVAIAPKSYIFPITACTDIWCKVEMQSPKMKGYVLTKHIWGRTK